MNATKCGMRVCEVIRMTTEIPGQGRRTNLTSQVMENVKNYIVDNDLRPGDRLPTEKELVAELGISRNILREGLKSLEALGLIEIRVGDGTYVRQFDYATVLSHISFAVSRTKQELEHFMHARVVIEVGALRYIVDRIEDEDIDALEEILDRYDQATTLESSAKVDLEFHQQLLALSRNPILAEFGMFLGRFFIEALYFVNMDPKPHTSTAHRDLIQTLRERDLAKASEIMRDHILSWDIDFAMAPSDINP
jgi:GntR family transcriptional regulator, transcriptional repressor for pyruvate dehydrogenase complex